MDREFFHKLYVDLNGLRVFLMQENEGWRANLNHPMLNEVESIMERVADIERKVNASTR